MKIGIFRDPLCLKHSNAPAHPERPDRLHALNAMIERYPDPEALVDLPARDATVEELTLIHAPAYIESIRATELRRHTYLDPDTGANSHTWRAALRSAGAGLSAVEAVLSGTVPSAFVLTRPPGHHAERDRAMGFCIFNNVALAAEHAIHRYGLRRVAVVDWDVHHGNGTQKRFYGRNDLLYISLHQYPHYPGTGAVEETGVDAGAGFTMNIPLRQGQGDAQYRALFDDLVCPVLAEYGPQLILVSAGFDAHADDPLAGMKLTESTYAYMTQRLRTLPTAAPLVFLLEGGYNLAALSGGVAAVLSTLALSDLPGTDGGLASTGGPARTKDSGYVETVEKRVRKQLGPFWDALRDRA